MKTNCILCGGGLSEIVGRYSWVNEEQKVIMSLENATFWACDNCGEIILPLETVIKMDEEESKNPQLVKSDIKKIKDAIKHTKEVAENTKCGECAEEHKQLAEWLQELIKYKELKLKHDDII